MAKVVEVIGSTYEEALNKGLEQLGLTEDKVDVEIVKDSSQAKKSFFSILEPRQVKILISEKSEGPKSQKREQSPVVERPVKEIVELDEQTIEAAKSKITAFLDNYYKAMGMELKTSFDYKEGYIRVTIEGENTGLIIGHRGETLEALQALVTTIVNKDSSERIRLIFDSENYREKRTNSLKGLALREAEQVVRTKRSYTFEPMTAFERKAIHTALQNHPKVTTQSIGEEPYRKVVISLK